MITSAGDLLAVAGLKRGSVKVEGQDLAIREMNVAERAELLRLVKEGKTTEAHVSVVKSCVLGGDGKPFLSDEHLAALQPSVCDEIALAVLRLSGLKLEGDDPKNA